MRKNIIAMAALILPLSALADHPTISIEGGAAGPITTVSAITPPKGIFGLSLQSQMIFNDEISDNDLRHFSALGENIHSTESIYTLGTNAVFAASDDLTLGMSLPYIWRTNIREAGHQENGGHGDSSHANDSEHGGNGDGTVERLGDSDGIGDMTVYGKFRFFHDDVSNRHIALIAGVRTPSGQTGERTAGGELFEAEHQPGSGSWNPLVGLAFTQQRGPWSLDANILYTFTTEGTQNTDLGDIFNYNLAVSYRFLREHEHATNPQEGKNAIATPHHEHGSKWDLLVEMNGDLRDKVRVNGVADGNTGGNLIFLSVGTRVSWGQQWAASVSAGIPVVKNLDGVQSEAKARLLFGISKAF